jgi:pyrroloquinoline quinone biosynthesis protein B
MPLRIRILGSAAGGGLPQWNCGCDHCARVRSGDPAIAPRTQDSIVATADGEQFVLCNVSPDVLRQLERTPELWPRTPRHSPIAAIVLTNGDIDHVAGLLSLRERTPLVIYATARVLAGLFEQNVLLRTLQRFPGHLTLRPLALGVETTIAGIGVTALAVPGKPPIHLETSTADAHPKDNVALELRVGERRIVYAPSIGTLDDPSLLRRLADADRALVDGTFWSDDELIARGVGEARASTMAHLPVRDALPLLSSAGVRPVLVHLNNTNPLVVEGSPERLLVEQAGFVVAHDGMELCA